ncbi:hypothetical protein, partial [Salmonella enterica]|uniref:hypothetical protein n=1 Tax=Salmonella enterica TaxID=28901 RepID=UPI003FA73705
MSAISRRRAVACALLVCSPWAAAQSTPSPAPAAGAAGAPASTDGGTLPEVKASTRAETATGPVRGYT